MIRCSFVSQNNNHHYLAMQVTDDRQDQLLSQLIHKGRHLRENIEKWVIIQDNIVDVIQLESTHLPYTEKGKKPSLAITSLWNYDYQWRVNQPILNDVIVQMLNFMKNCDDIYFQSPNTQFVHSRLNEVILSLLCRIYESVNGQEDIDAKSLNQALIDLGIEPLAKWHINYLTGGASFEASLANEGTTKITIAEYLQPLFVTNSGE